ncbi:MAG: tetratricopeptide repeat protein [Planctomycetota bacterium]
MRFPSALLAIASAGLLPAQQDGPTWSSSIASLVHRSCTPCHRAGQPAPFDLIAYDDVRRRADFVLEVVEDGYMPPWQPSEGHFLGDRRLSEAEIASLRQWVAAGAPRGDAASEPAAPRFAGGWQLGEPDLVVRMPDTLDVPAGGADIVRNFVVPVAVEELRYVAALEIRPGNRAVHHAVLAVDSTRQSRQRDARDEPAGFPGMTLGSASPPDGHFLGWTPGKSVRRNEPGMAWRLHPGDDFVLQLHAVPTGKRERVQPEIGIWFSKVPTKRVYDMAMLFSEEIDIAVGEQGFVLKDHVVLPVPVTLHAIYPHAHYVCRSMRAVATLPDGTARTLFAIEDWDFDWQDDYRYREPIELPANTHVAMRYVYDNSEANSNNPTRPLQRVRFGQDSADEMGTLTLSMTLRDPGDRAQLMMALTDRDLEKLPDAWNLLVRKSRLERERGRFATAQKAIERACKVSPGSPEVWFERGVLAEARRDLDQAASNYQRAIAIDGGFALAHMRLGMMYGRIGKDRQALRHFGAAVRALPNSPEANNNFATANYAVGKLGLAEQHYRRAVALAPDYFNARFNLGRVLLAMGRKSDAKVELEQARKLRPDVDAIRELLRSIGG